MNVIRLHGEIGERFGAEYELAVSTVREAFTALCAQLEGFEDAVRAGAFRITRTKREDVTELDEETLDLAIVECTIDVYPAMAGAKNGLTKILLGLTIVAVAVIAAPAAAAGASSFLGASMGASVGFLGLTFGTVATFGAMIAFGGAAMLFAPSPKAQNATDSERTDSYILNTPINASQQGLPIPLIYGRVLTGSLVVSSAMTIEQLLQSGETFDIDDVYAGYGFGSWPNTDVNLV